MKRFSLTIFLCITLGLTNLYSQKIKVAEPEKVTISDFSADGDKSVCLWYGSFFTFPYNYSHIGAYDYLFSLKNETYMRVLLNKSDTNTKFLILHKSNQIIPLIKSIQCYYLNNNIIASVTKDEESVIIINYFEKGFYFDLSSLKDIENNVIVDLKFTYSSKSKKEISCHIDRNRDYKYLTIRLDIPEIYKYKFTCDYETMTVEIKKPVTGPVIGFGPLPGGTGKVMRFTSRHHWDLIYNTYPLNAPGQKIIYMFPVPYYSMLYPYIFKSKKSIISSNEDLVDNFPAIVKFDLLKINEIGPIK